MCVCVRVRLIKKQRLIKLKRSLVECFRAEFYKIRDIVDIVCMQVCVSVCICVCVERMRNVGRGNAGATAAGERCFESKPVRGQTI